MDHNLTAQDVFSRSYLHVVKQGRPAAKPGSRGNCMYLTPTGLRCAIGALIDDKTAKLWDKYGALSAVINAYGDEKITTLPAWAEPNRELLDRIQICHDVRALDFDEQPDEGRFVAAFKRSMAWVAEDFGLTVPDPDYRPDTEETDK